MAERDGGRIEIRCRCGQVYRADPSHAGRSLRCRCGRTLRIKPADTPLATRLTGTAARLRRSLAQRMSRRVTRQVRVRARRPATQLDRWLTLLVPAYLALAVFACALLWGLGDVWWPATVALYGPRWVLLLPAAVLLPLAVYRRRGVTFVVVAALVTLGPVMGFRLGSRNWLGAPRPSIRVVTYNVAGGRNVLLSAVLLNLKPDVVAFQECGGELAEAIEAADGWHKDISQSLCLLSRFPIKRVDSLGTWLVEGYGFSGAVLHYTLQMPDRVVHLVNVHLETPRKGLERFRYGGDTRRIGVNTELREIASLRARRWIDSIPGSPIIVGDFNTPVESRIYQRSWGDLTNAFSQAGFGLGGSRVLKHFRIRIDHVLFHDDWRAVDVFLGPDFGSDHVPMVADLAWTPSR